MNKKHRMSPRMLEDLQPRLTGGPDMYARTTDKPIHYVEIANAGVLYGYIWAADEDDAAAFLQTDSGDDAANAAIAWSDKLLECKARGITPTQALAELSADPGGRRIGRVVPGSQAEATSLTALRTKATGN